MEEVGEHCRAMAAAPSSFAAEIPRDPMELLSRSWSVSALEVSKALAPPKDGGAATGAVGGGGGGGDGGIVEEELELEAAMAIAAAGNPFSFATSATSQLVMERIMAQSLMDLQQEVSPRTSGRLSHSSGPLNGGHSCGSLSDSPPVSPSDADDPNKYTRAAAAAAAGGGGAAATGQQYRGGSRTVGRWLKDRRERKKEETRAHNAQVHAAVSVAGVAAAVAAIAAATAVSAPPRGARTDMAVASAATLVAAQCVEAAEAMGAARDHLASVVSSAVNVRTPGDIITLTAAAATALRAAATLKARTLKEVWNIAAVTPVDKGQAHPHAGEHLRHHHHRRQRQQQQQPTESCFSGELPAEEENFLGLCSRELLARGTELLKRTRKGDLHWKVVSVYINKTGQVMLKMKSKHVAGTITKKKKNVVAGVCRDVAAWPGRHLLDGGEQRRYFGLRTAERRVIEFECRSQREHDLWTSGVERLLVAVANKPKLPP